VNFFDNASLISALQDEGDAGLEIIVWNKTGFHSFIQWICITASQA